jgi:4-alpha-glucanotransferase
LFDEAWSNYISNPVPYLEKSFEGFCKSEQSWLDDYALYLAIKQKQHGEPWHEWPEAYKFRDKLALDHFAGENRTPIQKIKWLQFMFTRQLLSLKDYCKSLGIQLLGDLPFYVAYDSADVWACPELFSLDDKLNIKLVAGVPPDYFNADGQLWGMPVFNWEKLGEQKYAWWIKRIRRNIQLFDLLRMDHFRAFSSCWAVAADQKTAVNGNWEKGPGAAFFITLQKEFGKLPFVAEDLGDIDDDVYKLRDQFGLPGMKVLQFAFGDDMLHSPHIPHNYTENYFAYTGTHDNNTTRGWFGEEAGKAEKHHIKRYTDHNFSDSEISLAFIKLIMASAAKTTIFPVQDLLGLDESARLNTPAGTAGNWTWQLKAHELRSLPEKKLKEWTRLFNRS